MAGLSAGSLCWFEEGVSDSIRTGELHPIRGLGFLSGSHCPHYDGERDRRPRYQELIREGKLGAGYAVDDGAALHFVGAKLERVVAERPRARVYRVSRSGDGIEEIALETELLG
jgi:peptidase E